MAVDLASRDAVAATDHAGAAGAFGVRVVDHPMEKVETLFGERDMPVIWGYLEPVVSEVAIGATHLPPRTYMVGDLRFVGPGTAIRRRPQKATVIRALELPSAAFTECLGDQAGDLQPALARLQHETFRSPMIELLIERLAAAEKVAAPPLYAQSLAHSVIFELWRIAGDADRRDEAAIGLDAATLDKIDRFIDAEAAEKIDLGALARLAGMPLAAFSRTFKTATGKTPYQYVLTRRIAMARSMLSTTRLSLAEIAYQCGFSSQSHMTDVFKTKVGVSPGIIRKSVH